MAYRCLGFCAREAASCAVEAVNSPATAALRQRVGSRRAIPRTRCYAAAAGPTESHTADTGGSRQSGVSNAAPERMKAALELYRRGHSVQLEDGGAVHPSHRVYANNEVHLADVDVIGFDYDYTLANYRGALLRLVYRLARDFLIEDMGYPKQLAAREYDPTFGIRGLTVDRKKALLMKVSSFNAITIGSVFRGRQRLSEDEILKEYGGSRFVSFDYREASMAPLADLFSLPHACILADTVQYFLDHKYTYDPESVASDVYQAIQYVHKSGAMHKTVLQDISQFLRPDPRLRTLLERLAGSGKQLFLLTNSGFTYVDAGLRYLLGDDWRQLFEVVIVNASKPAFYTKPNVPFRELGVKHDRMLFKPVTRFKPNRVYARGCVHGMLQMAGWERKHVLYFGDSMFSDWVEPRRAHGWTTGGIIKELDEYMVMSHTDEFKEIRAKLRAVNEMLQAVQEIDLEDETHASQLGELCEWVSSLPSYLKLVEARASVAAVSEDEEELTGVEGPKLGSLTKIQVLDALENERRALRKRRQMGHNENFGSMFHSDTSPSLFAFSLMVRRDTPFDFVRPACSHPALRQRYCDIYTSDVSNFLHYGDDHRFYPNPKILPHQSGATAV